MLIILLSHAFIFCLPEPKRFLRIVAAKAAKDPETTVNTTVDDTSAALEDVLKKVQEAVLSMTLIIFSFLLHAVRNIIE